MRHEYSANVHTFHVLGRAVVQHPGGQEVFKNRVLGKKVPEVCVSTQEEECFIHIEINRDQEVFEDRVVGEMPAWGVTQRRRYPHVRK